MADLDVGLGKYVERPCNVLELNAPVGYNDDRLWHRRPPVSIFLVLAELDVLRQLQTDGSEIIFWRVTL